MEDAGRVDIQRRCLTANGGAGTATKEAHVSREENPRYLRFSNIFDRHPISAYCNQCERKFVGVYRAEERTDDVLLRIRAEFDAHRCDATAKPTVN
jgi:hypothetical protein